MILFIYNSYIGSGLVSEDISKFVVRIPSDLHEEIKGFAEQDNRSLNKYIAKVLEEHVQQKKISSKIGNGEYDLSAETIDMIIHDIIGKRINKNSSDK
jgi:hypothetical protein